MNHLLKMEKQSVAVPQAGIPHAKESSLFCCGIGECAMELLKKLSLGIPNATKLSGPASSSE
jgi:hypothetical protein